MGTNKTTRNLLFSQVLKILGKHINKTRNDRIKYKTMETKAKQKVGKLPLIPREVWPDPTAVKACSICTSFPEGLLDNSKHIINKK